MPNLGGKIWFTAIAGLLLGFVLFGMLQRGCDAEGVSQIATTADRSEPVTRDFSANRNNARTQAPAAKNNRNSNSAKGRRNGARRSANSRRGTNSRTPTANRRTALERSAAARTRADAARKAELARLTRERTQKYRDRARRFSADDPNVIDPAVRTNTTGVGLENSVAQAAAEAGAELRAQRGEGGSGSGSGAAGGGGGPGGRDADGGNGPGEGENAAGDEFSELASLLEGLGIDQSFIDLIQQVVSGATPPVNPFDPTDDDDDLVETDDPVIPIDPDAEQDLTSPVIARWAPIDNSSCSDLSNQGLGTRDLYLAFLTQPLGAPVLSSKDTNTLRIVDGSFHQTPLGTNGPPVISTDDCQRYDSYLTIGKAAPVFLSAPDPADWGEQLLAEWFVLTGAEISQNPDAFGDDRYYIHIGRFTAEEGAMIFGRLRVDYAGELAIVDVPDWMGADIGDLIDVEPPVLPKVINISVVSSGVLGGETLQGSVTIDTQAPAGGTRVSLTTDRPGRVLLPAAVVIPEGQQTAAFQIQTIANGIIEDVTITALTDDSQRSTSLRLDAPAISSFESLEARLLDGQSTSVVLRLTHPAGENGVTISLAIDQPDALELPATVRIPAGQFRTVFQVKAAEVESETTVTLRATVGGQSQDLTFVVSRTVRLVDVNMDGVIDTADLGMLIGSFGTSDERFDFNRDGIVDTADLGLLSSLFGETYDIGDDGPDDNPGNENDAVIARWIEVPQGDCDEFPGTRTAELFLGFKASGVLPVISSDSDGGLTVSSGEFVQHPFGSNEPPSQALIDSFPCVVYDSFLSVGDVAGVILGVLNQNSWGSTLAASWFSINGTEERDPFKFGDNRYYVRIGRFTGDATATMSGTIRVDFAGSLAMVEVPDWSNAAAVAMDLNFDGQVDAVDVAMVTRAYGTTNPAYDFDGDGTVDGDDLRPLLQAIQNGPGS